MALRRVDGVFAIDRLTIGYLGLTGLWALALGGGGGALVAAVHLLACLAIHNLRRFAPDRGLAEFLRVGYPVLAMPVLYAELATLNRYLTPRFFDQTVIAWDRAILRLQPSMDLSGALPWFPLSEGLHLGYMGYYLLMPAALIGAYLATGRAGLHRTVFTLMATFYVCYAIFIVFPVAGPRYAFEPIRGTISEGSLYHMVHAILESGSSKGTAFPSSHVAASLAAVLGVAREDRRWWWALLVPEIALIVGTVYGRFHYGIDALVGLVIGVLVWVTTPAMIGVLAGRQPGRASGYQTK